MFLLQEFYFYFNHNHESGVKMTSQEAVASFAIKRDCNSLRIINMDLTSVIKTVTCLADNRKQTPNHVLRNWWIVSQLKRHSFKPLVGILQ